MGLCRGPMACVAAHLSTKRLPRPIKPLPRRECDLADLVRVSSYVTQFRNVLLVCVAPLSCCLYLFKEGTFSQEKDHLHSLRLRYMVRWTKLGTKASRITR